MDRPSNGHRRHDAGSVTVVDLIRRQNSGPIRIPSISEADTIQFMDDLLGPMTEPPEHPRSWLARGAKLAGLAFGSLVLCGSVYAASTLTQHRPQQTATGPSSTVLTGVGALLPNTVAAALSQTGPATVGPTPLHTPLHTPTRSTATGMIAGGPAAPAQVAPRPAGSPTDGLVSPADVVRVFYQLVATDPSLAAQLLAPSLLSGDAASFDDAWQSLSNVQIESVQQTSPRTAQAVIRMLEPDGSWLRVIELLHVTGGDHPLINGAELLSAQRG